MQIPIRIRRLRGGDTAQMLALHTAAVTRACGPALSRQAVAAWLSGRTHSGFIKLVHKGERFCIAEGSGVGVLGFASWRGDELLSLYIHPDWQGLGIGKRLVAACEGQARADGWRLRRVTAIPTAESFYARLGFRRLRHSLRYKQGQAIPQVEMVRD